MFRIKRLSECTFAEAVQAWNEGFKGYYADMSTTLDRFVIRLGKEDLSPELSIVAFAENRPVGFVLNLRAEQVYMLRPMQAAR
jgi:hypothetical protein